MLLNVLVTPFAYREMTLPTSPLRRRCYFGRHSRFQNVPRRVARDPQLNVADLRGRRLVVSAVAGVAAPSGDACARS
jgi:hypothetical protein